MFFHKVKPRRCRYRKCRTEFTPVRPWQKYCSVRCRAAVKNLENRRMFRKAQQIIAEHEKEIAS